MAIEVTQDLLLAETHHRMMNTLALMAGSLRREFAPFRDATVRDALSRHERMIVAFGELHGCLTVGSRRNAGTFAAYLARLCRALDGAILRPLGFTCEVEAADGFEPDCPPERVGLVVAELVTNAAKHAFKGRDAGVVTVALARADDGWQLTVADNGRGMGAAGCGVGAALLSTLVKAAGGTMAVRTGATGTAFVVTFPAGRGPAR